MTFQTWRRIHRTATFVLGSFALLHCGLTFVVYDEWSADSVWFLGTGLSLLLLAVLNWSHVGLDPCDLPTAPVVRWANCVFVLFAIAAVIAVPEPQAYLILIALVVQAIAGFGTLGGSTLTRG